MQGKESLQVRDVRAQRGHIQDALSSLDAAPGPLPSSLQLHCSSTEAGVKPFSALCLPPLPEGPVLDVVLPSQLSAHPTLLVLGLQAGCPPGPLPPP